MQRRRKNPEQQNIGREERKSSVGRTLATIILSTFFGLIGGLSADYLKTFLHFLDISDIHAYMLFLSPYKNSFELQLVLVNPGNRQGAISELTIGYSVNGFGYFPFLPPQATIQGLPVLLNPGDMRLVTIRGTLPINSMYENGSPVNPATDSSTSAEGDKREVTITLRFRALDFRGQRYEGKWDVGKMSMTSENVAGVGLYSYALSVFDKRYYSGENIWFSLPSASSVQQ